VAGFSRGLDPLADPPNCGHGRMVRVTGYSKRSGRYFASFMCPTEQPLCTPVWVNVDTIITEALSVWRGFDADAEDSDAA
jgi:hypothetical protein